MSSCFAATGAWGFCTASGLALAVSHVSSGDSPKRAVAFSRICTALQGRSSSLKERSAHHIASCTSTRINRINIRKRATGSGCSWKKAAGHNGVKASITVPPRTLPMTDHLLVLKGSEEDARQEINRAGGRILHWIGDNVFVATLGQDVDVNSFTYSFPLPENYEGSSAVRDLIQAWRGSKKDELFSQKDSTEHWAPRAAHDHGAS